MNRTNSILTAMLAFVLSAGLATPLVAAETKTEPAKKSEKAAKIDINTATQEQLMELPGVGEVTAKKIIENRPYKSTSDLSKAGLSDAAIKKIAPHATAKKSKGAASAKPTPKSKSKTSKKAASTREPASKNGVAASAKKVDLNTASEKELEELPGIGPVSAKKIIEHRPYSSASELSKAGLSAASIDKISGRVTANASEKAATRGTPRSSNAAASRSRTRTEAPTPEPTPTAVTPRAEPRATAPRAERSTPQSQSGKVDLNTASLAELEALPGVGPVYAKKIIDNRPYASAGDLSKAGLPTATLQKIEGSVTVKSSDKVWLNTDSNIFHRADSAWYGKTKSGKFVTEKEALDAGAREAER